MTITITQPVATRVAFGDMHLPGRNAQFQIVGEGKHVTENTLTLTSFGVEGGGGGATRQETRPPKRQGRQKIDKVDGARRYYWAGAHLFLPLLFPRVNHLLRHDIGPVKPFLWQYILLADRGVLPLIVVLILSCMGILLTLAYQVEVRARVVALRGPRVLIHSWLFGSPCGSWVRLGKSIHDMAIRQLHDPAHQSDEKATQQKK